MIVRVCCVVELVQVHVPFARWPVRSRSGVCASWAGRYGCLKWIVVSCWIGDGGVFPVDLPCEPPSLLIPSRIGSRTKSCIDRNSPTPAGIGSPLGFRPVVCQLACLAASRKMFYALEKSCFSSGIQKRSMRRGQNLLPPSRSPPNKKDGGGENKVCGKEQQKKTLSLARRSQCCRRRTPSVARARSLYFSVFLENASMDLQSQRCFPFEK